MINDPYRFMWRTEIDADYPMHTYITKGTELYGWVKKDTSEVVMFSKPFKTWSPSRRKFRKLGKKEIAQILKESENGQEA